jgi:hypothetical protein
VKMGPPSWRRGYRVVAKRFRWDVNLPYARGCASTPALTSLTTIHRLSALLGHGGMMWWRHG